MNKVNKKPGVGVGVMILKNGKILLGERHSDPKKAGSELHGEGTWTMPGGKLEFGEELRDCAYREVLEETSIKVNAKTLKLISVSDDIVKDAHYVTIGLLSKDFKGKVKIMEPDEIEKWSWFDLKKLPKKMFFPSQRIIKNYISKTILK